MSTDQPGGQGSARDCRDDRPASERPALRPGGCKHRQPADGFDDEGWPTCWVELRIHGVSGTPPETMLDVKHVVQVAGDDGRRIYQRVDETGSVLPRDDDGRVLEGYHWGSLTSGSWKQALWL